MSDKPTGFEAAIEGATRRTSRYQEGLPMSTILYSTIDMHVRALCKAVDLNLDPDRIRSINITPNTLTIDTYDLNADGRKYVNLDTGKAATTAHEFKVIV